MSVIDRDLVKAVNSGRCFALIGSGPSCEMGVPSWKMLASSLIEEIIVPLKTEIGEKCHISLSKKEYPKIFSEGERLVGISKLVAFVGQMLVKKKDRGSSYQYIAQWPFACYLTTNYDDYLLEELDNIGSPFIVKRNSRDDMVAIRSDSRSLIVKIHGDASNFHDIVLTEEQYAEFREGAARNYWREKIRSVLHMVDLIIIGYSAEDPDFRDQLERAKELASPDHPVFMFATGMTTRDIKEYFLKYNIRVISYENRDGNHQELKRLFRLYQPFIAKRGTTNIGLEPINEEIAQIASSLHLFTQLRVADTHDEYITRVYESLILQILSNYDKSGIEFDKLRSTLSAKIQTRNLVDPAILISAVECLHASGLILVAKDMSVIVLEPKGREWLETIKAQRDLIREKFEKASRLFLKREYRELTESSANSVISAISQGIIRAYEKRGLEIAKSVFAQNIFDISDAPDILETINKSSSLLRTDPEKIAFADLMLEIMLRPDYEMKEYLSTISQGYFAYHALGLEPGSAKERINIAREKKWLLDSSILLPILAIDCSNHFYAKDLLDKMKELGFLCCTTARLFDEVREHAYWAMVNFGKMNPRSIDFIQAAVAAPPYRQNLFIDGYIKWSLNKGNPTFQQYLNECLGPRYSDDLSGSIGEKLEKNAIKILDITEWYSFSNTSWPERDFITAEIEKMRKQYGTYRGESQCIAEAEVVLISQKEKIAFLSQSGVLDRLNPSKPRMTWKPEGIYRFLSLISTRPVGSDLLYDCMMQDFYYSGFDIIDKKAFSQYMGDTIRQARMEFDQERERYENALGKREFVRIKDEFERIPDERKPFYSLQFAFHVAKMEGEKAKAAEARARFAEQVGQLTEKDREELARLRMDQKERKRKAEQRRRRSQSSAKHRKRKKGKK